ncbi:MAG: hypothetical protein H6713_34555 [Myxococcales bacterium]|nr:hypothetical protein [Myxococcales bacterium]
MSVREASRVLGHPAPEHAVQDATCGDRHPTARARAVGPPCLFRARRPAPPVHETLARPRGPEPR